jgi:ATP-binding cassette subfamily B protein
MRKKLEFFSKSLELVWRSAPALASLNALFSVVRSFMPLLLIWLVKNVVDVITFTAGAGRSDNPVGGILMPVAILAIAWFIDEALSDVFVYIRGKQSLKFEDYMYGLIHKKSARIDLINFEKSEYYNCLSRASKEATWRPNNILNNLISLLRAFVSFIALAVLIIAFNPLLAILLLLANLPGIWLKLHYSDKLYNFQKKETPEERKASYFNWLLTGERPSREIRLFGLAEYFRDHFRASFVLHKKKELEIIRKRTSVEILSDLVKAGAFLIALWAIAVQAVEGSISLGRMAMLLLAFRQSMVSMKELFGAVSGLYEDGLYIGDTFEFLNLGEKISSAGTGLAPLSLCKSIVLENISFSYNGNHIKAIDNLSLELKKGEIVAVVGRNGAGKSTLAKLLCRLYDPDSGSIKYDGNDIRDFDPEEYRKQFSVIFQDFMLYNLAAGENIRLGDVNNKSTAKIIDRAKSAGIHELIEKLPQGYETLIGNLFEGSRELSWGEWQKIALARALYRDSQVLIMDEPSSALDPESEYEIFARVRNILKVRTSVLISHRLTSTRLADRIIVMDKGKIIETGDHDTLMNNKGLYYSIFTKQHTRIGE